MGWTTRWRGGGRATPPDPVTAEASAAARSRAAARSFADVGVPDLAEPVYARAMVLDVDRGHRRHSALVEVQPPGGEPYRAELRSGSDPGGFAGLVIRWHVPVLTDGAAPDTVILLEPPCGPDLPSVAPEMQTVRDARDLRTAALADRYRPPSAAELAAFLAPTATVVHPAWDAVCYRLGLLTTLEARAVVDGIRSDGNAWDRAEAELYSWGPSIPDDLRTRVGAFVSHLDDVAPHGRGIDRAPFWTFGVAALMRDLHPDEVDAQVFGTVMRPFVGVCGALPDRLA